jgi:phosphatidate cytidylyltransferase
MLSSLFKKELDALVGFNQMLLRIFTGLTLLLFGITVIYLGNLPFLLWILTVSLLCTIELMLLLKKGGYKPFNYLAILITTIIFITLLPLSINNSFASLSEQILAIWLSFPVKIAVLSLILFYLSEVILKKFFLPKNNIVANIRIILFIISTFPFIYLLRAGNNGLLNMLFCCSIIWIGDIAAYFSGKFWGRHKLSILSPKKTIEGTVAGLLGGLAAAFVFIFYFKLNLLLYTIMAVVISIVAPLGDLHESLTKRYFNVKDSSNILPGHGGIYDRADSTLFVMPLMFYFFN